MNFWHIWRTSCDNFEVALAEAAPQQLLPLQIPVLLQRDECKDGGVKEEQIELKMKEKLALLCALVHFSLAQDLTLPYFNIAEKKKVTVNATCGEDPTRKDVYCKLAGYDSFLPQTRSDILDGQVN